MNEKNPTNNLATKKNILLLSFDFRLEAGGVENTSYLMAEELRQYMNVFTFCPGDGHMPAIDGVNAYKSKYPNTGWNKLFNYFNTQKEVESIHKKYHIDYTLCFNYICSKPAIFLHEKYGVPFGILAHGNEVMKFYPKELLTRPINSLISLYTRRISLERASHIFTNTTYTQSLVQEITKRRDIHVIHPPIRNVQKLNTIGSLEKRLVILSVGRLVRRKGYLDVIKALPIVVNKFPEIQYIIAGDGGLENEIRYLIKSLRLENHVQLLGRVSEEEKIRLFLECDIFVMPSFMIKKERSVEGFGLSLVEANLFGKFVISTYSGGIPEAVIDGKTGFLINEHDIDGLANAIIRFYSSGFDYSPEVCVDWARQHDISVITRQYWDVISEYLGKQP